MQARRRKKLVTLLDLCVSSLRRGHTNLLCIVPILSDDRRSESKKHSNKKLVTLLDLCVSSLRRGHTNLLCIVPILSDDRRSESKKHSSKKLVALLNLCVSSLRRSHANLLCIVPILSDNQIQAGNIATTLSPLNKGDATDFCAGISASWPNKTSCKRPKKFSFLDGERRIRAQWGFKSARKQQKAQEEKPETFRSNSI